MADKLPITIDLSSTGPKFFYGDRENPLPGIFAPQVVEVVTPQEQEDTPSHMVISYGGRTFLTGQAARNYSRGINYIKEAKASKAVPQVLSAIAYAADRMNLSNKLIVDIKCLLPAGEIKNDRTKLLQEISEAVQDFASLTRHFKCKLSAPVVCQPEGMGLLQRFAENAHKVSGQTLEDLSIGVLSIGYRNAGFFSSIEMKPGHYRSPRLGFSLLVEEFRSSVGNLDEADIVKDLSNYLETSDRNHLIEIATQYNKDLDVLVQRADEAIAFYCEELRRDSSEFLPNAKYLIVGGGTAQALGKKMSQCINRTHISLHAGLGRDWDYPDRLKEILKEDKYYRFADLYCFC